MPEKPPAIRLVTKCTSVEDFVRVFHPFADQSTILVPIKKVPPPGEKCPFIIMLANREPVMEGRCEIVNLDPDQSRLNLSRAARLKILYMNSGTREIHRRLMQAKAKVLPPPAGPSMVPSLSDVPRTPPPLGNLDQTPLVTPRATTWYERSALARALPTASKTGAATDEKHKPSAAYTLPANPLGDLSPEAILAFVECSLFEEAGWQALPLMKDGSGDSPPGPTAAPSDVSIAEPDASAVEPMAPIVMPAAAPHWSEKPSERSSPLDSGSWFRPLTNTPVVSAVACVCSLLIGFWLRGLVTPNSPVVILPAAAPQPAGGPHATAIAMEAVAGPTHEPPNPLTVAEAPPGTRPVASVMASTVAAREDVTNTRSKMRGAHLYLTSDPPGAAITLDRRPLGATPRRVKVTLKRRVLIAATKTGYEPWSKRIYLKKAETKVRIELVPRASVPGPSAASARTQKK